MARNVYFSHGTKNEQYLIEDLIVESLGIYGQDFYYIPRSLVSKDEILGEDRLSEFKTAYPVEMYMEKVDGFEGQGAFIQKFGLMMEQSATLVVARRRWEQLVGEHETTILPNRPCEGDLIYYPLSGGLFEIKFVQHQDPFYQLGKLYVYKLQVELFQYASERINTGIKEIDEFETLKTLEVDSLLSHNGQVISLQIVDRGSGYTTPPGVVFHSSSGVGAAATTVLGTGMHAGQVMEIILTNPGYGYHTPPEVALTGTHTTPAHVTAAIKTNVDLSESFGDNNKFKKEGAAVAFDEDNPFGEIV